MNRHITGKESLLYDTLSRHCAELPTPFTAIVA